jgi:frizzled protein 5/8
MDPQKNQVKTPSRLPLRSSQSCCQCNTSIGYHLIEDDDYSPVKKCLPPCRSAYFSDQKTISLINTWLIILSILCALSCTFVLLTFFIDMTRFKYPQRPIIFLSLCYFFVSCGYLIRLILGHENVACRYDLTSYVQLVRVSGPSSCTFVFVLTYFFGMASSIWWVILTLTWFLAAGFKWSSEAIAHYSLYYHLFAWLLPCLQTIAILILKGIDGDPISGICYVGHTDSSMLRGFVLLPLISFLTVGTIFLLAGLISLMRIRNVIKIQDRSKTSKLEKLMVRIGLFSILYTVPATFVS